MQASSFPEESMAIPLAETSEATLAGELCCLPRGAEDWSDNAFEATGSIFTGWNEFVLS
eukprot:CAMPEP_0184515196 /NCGR_PEP_ID=MMETSP0198_2-20121128/4368_1 /TAXON_ID=1112570 /ORGANISM="Thraustochytrium sp., Strain LLF1b" /LENGTH=58 /DNA_ID=CAMNT_0026905437 /DNA_START=576 /DNA_END=752 /DNA_ORIENTATION=-